MNGQSNCCASGSVTYAALAILIAGGVLGGLYLSGGWPGTTAAPNSNVQDKPADSPQVQRFSLTSFDAKDPHEAPELAADAAGNVYLTWSSQTSETERTVYLSRMNAGGDSFNKPTVVSQAGIAKFVSQMKGKTITRSSHSDPHLAVSSDGLYLAWTEAMPDLANIRMVLARSTNLGDSFGEPAIVHQGRDARPTYTALALGLNGTVACSWLDNRDKSQQPFASVREPGTAAFGEESSVHIGKDGRGVCPCCPTSSIVAPDGTVYVAFRNVEDGYRDIVISRKKPGQSTFEGPFRVVPPTWKFDGCPHDGASMVIVGDSIHIVWMDARTGVQKCHYGRAKLVDMKFETTELNSQAVGSQGNAKLFVDAGGILHAVWEESIGAEPVRAEGEHRHGPPQVGQGGGRAIMHAQKDSCCDSFGPAKAIAAKPGAFQTRPSITGAKKGELIIAWNELSEEGKAIVVKRIGCGDCQ